MDKKIKIDGHTERSRGGMESKFRIAIDTSVTPRKGKQYLIQILSQKLDNGKPDKLFGAVNFLAKFNGKFFFIGSLKRRRALHQVKVITEAVVDKGKL
jgi:hypothetical protein